MYISGRINFILQQWGCSITEAKLLSQRPAPLAQRPWCGGGCQGHAAWRPVHHHPSLAYQSGSANTFKVTSYLPSACQPPPKNVFEIQCSVHFSQACQSASANIFTLISHLCIQFNLSLEKNKQEFKLFLRLLVCCWTHTRAAVFVTSQRTFASSLLMTATICSCFNSGMSFCIIWWFIPCLNSSHSWITLEKFMFDKSFPPWAQWYSN